MSGAPRIIVIGLGYVGLPLAVALARHFDVTGFDIDPERIAELRDGRRPDPRSRRSGARGQRSLDADRTMRAIARGADVYIVTVPTPGGRAEPAGPRPRCSPRRARSPS